MATTQGTNTDFLSSVYRSQTGRESDAGGMEYWQGQLDSGMSRDDVVNRFDNSEEGIAYDANVGIRDQLNYMQQSFNNRVMAGETYWGPSWEGAALAVGGTDNAAYQNLYNAQKNTGHGGLIEQELEPIEQTSDGTLTGAQAHGYTAETYTPGGRADTYGYGAPDKASVERYGANKFTPDTDALAAYQLNKLTSRDDPYMQAARHSGEEYANSRGLLNSSLGAEASQAAAIKAALPLAQQDAATFAQSGRDYANAQNRAAEFGAGAENTASLAHNLQLAEADKFKASADNLASREEMASVNRAAEFNATAINRAGEFYANAQNQASIVNANNELSLALQGMRDEMSTYSTDVARETALDQIAYNTMNMAMQNGVFNNPATSAGFFNTIAGIIPSLGIQIATNLADAIPLSEIA